MQTIFRIHKKTGEVFALFPYEIADPQMNITYFSLSEGHSSCDYHKMIKQSFPQSINSDGAKKLILDHFQMKV